MSEARERGAPSGAADPNLEAEDGDGPYEEEDDAEDGHEEEDGDEDAGGDAGEDEDDEPEESQARRGSQDGPQEAARRGEPRVRHRGGAGESRRYSEVYERSRAAEQRAAQLEQQLNFLLQQQGQKSQAERDKDEAERVAQMSPGEFAQYIRTQADQSVQRQVGDFRRQIFHENNRNQFRELLARNRVAAAGERAHRARLEELRRLAPDVPERVLLATAIGEAAIERGETALARGSKRAAVDRERVRTRPASSGRDQPSERRRGGSEREQRAARLSGVLV